MLDELTPQEMDEWIAYANIEPFDNGWTQTAIIACTIHNMILSALYANAGKKPRRSDLLDIEDFMPVASRTKKRKRSNLKAISSYVKQQVDKWR